jgi:hypothetical protein
MARGVPIPITVSSRASSPRPADQRAPTGSPVGYDHPNFTGGYRDHIDDLTIS